MSDPGVLSPIALDPALAMIELSSIAAGIVSGDAMVKAAPVGSIYAGTIHPGKYLILVSGDTASVEEAFETGISIGGSAVLDTVFLPNIHPVVVGAIAGGDRAAWIDGEALGIVETETIPTVIRAADAGVKAAMVEVSAVQLGDGLGGKGYVLFSGIIGDVEAAVEAAGSWASEMGHLVESRIIAQLHVDMALNLQSDLGFLSRVALRPVERGS